MNTPILEMQGITKEFPGVKALNNVSFRVEQGEIHCLVGENGAGKSTLMKVLSGVYPHGTYSGDILLRGQVQNYRGIRDSEHAGIAIIYQELALEHAPFPQGHHLQAYGRIELRAIGGVETPLHRYAALSGVSDVGAGEPRFDGLQFHSASNGAHLRVLVIRRRDIYDAPNAIVVLDVPAGRAFLGSMGGMQMPDRNPFHGFGASTSILTPTDAERATVRFNAKDEALDAATGQPLLFLDREVPPPNVVDGLTTAWYFDPAREIVYSFLSGGIAGFHNRMATLMRFPHDDGEE